MKAIMRDEREMKDSGIEYLGIIPNNWNVASAKYFVKISNGSDPISEGDVPVYGSGKKSFRTCGEYKEGPAVLLGRKGTIDIPQYIEGRYWNVDTAFDVKNKDGYSLRYYYYLSTCFDYKRYSTQTALPSMTQSNYNDMRITVPVYSEQNIIANYLDDRCSKIDAIIAEAKASIEEYKDLKQAVIYEAVTKGLDKNVEMKDSGIEWIGTIPYQWHLEKINHIGVTSSGSTPARDKEDEYFANADISWIKTLDLNDGHVKYSSEKITLEALNSSSCSLMPVGTVCVAMYGGAGTIGKSGILDFECATNQAICSIICDREKQVGRYLQYQLQAMRSYWMKYAVGTRKDPNISQQTVAQMKVLVPPISTQRLIADYLDDKIIDLESLISEKQALIEDLESYKKSLIYEVVTGKRKVVA
ncbi:restriction endonuclease subunit S [uncultured Anaerovibrio sp.]|uniref:restriction endonuclease subunit S n=1 Tax=uncultured Anaerovibrio sp. TaxID=361586 RepID=UPI0025CD46DC|nr:restriction endonuclease subunit S [uncultured Anaerovibrio sp.]